MYFRVGAVTDLDENMGNSSNSRMGRTGKQEVSLDAIRAMQAALMQQSAKLEEILQMMQERGLDVVPAEVASFDSAIDRVDRTIDNLKNAIRLIKP